MLTYDSTPSPNVRSTVGIDCPRTKLMPNQWFQKLPTEKKTTWDGLLRGLGVLKSNGCTNLVQWLITQVFDSWAAGAAAPGKHRILKFEFCKHNGRPKIPHWLLWNLPDAKFVCIWHFLCIFGSGVHCRSGAVFRYTSEDEPCTEGQLMTCNELQSLL